MSTNISIALIVCLRDSHFTFWLINIIAVVKFCDDAFAVFVVEPISLN